MRTLVHRPADAMPVTLELSDAARAVLSAVRAHAASDGVLEILPGVVAMEAGLGFADAVRAIAELRRLGLIEPVTRGSRRLHRVR